MPNVDVACPSSTAGGCRCPQHHPGLAVHAQDPVAYEAALAALRPTTLRVVTAGPRSEVTCDGTLRCPCQPCVAERQELVHQGARGNVAQPWDPKPPRHLRAA